MTSQGKPDPFCAFKDDRERRIALTVRSCCTCLSTIVGTVAAARVDWMENLRWLMSLFH